jgi:phosphatidylserine/phosphatidylglycerophosphate/cardiolipin synthase-like enzyme
MRNVVNRLVKIVALIGVAAALFVGGYAAWHFQRGGTQAELAQTAADAAVWLTSDDRGVTRFVQRALMPVAQPGRAFEYVKSAVVEGRERAGQWMSEQQRRITDGSLRIKGLAERDLASRPGLTPDYTTLLQTAGAMLDPSAFGPSGVAGIEVYFGPVAVDAGEGIEAALIGLLEGATTSITCACHEIGHERFAAALAAAQGRGVRVAIVAESDYRDDPAVELLESAGVQMVFDERSALMHNKFCVVDKRYVWTGSANFTNNGFFRSYNNALKIESPELVANYAAEFEEMFAGGLFGRRSPSETPFPRIDIGGARIENYFAPEDGVENAIISEIASADSRIDFMMFSFTSEPIAEAMLARMVYGAHVRGVFEASQAGSEYSRDEWLAGRGAEIYIDQNDATMHHKVLIVDAETVITGSYNFSRAANTENDENVLIIQSAPLAARYLNVMDKLIQP